MSTPAYIRSILSQLKNISGRDDLIVPLQQHIEDMEALCVSCNRRIEELEAESRLKPHIKFMRWLGNLRFRGGS